MTDRPRPRIAACLVLAVASTALAQAPARTSASPAATPAQASKTRRPAPKPAVARDASLARIPPNRFLDPERRAKLIRAFPEIDKAFLNYAQTGNAPGVAWGVVIDGELVHSGAIGVRDVPSNAKAMPDSVFRIASMTKNFTAMAIMKLRDQGKLSLDSPAARYVPELRALAYPTSDSPAITVRHLLTHMAGFPEDNPWGDRQLAESDATLSKWMSAGLPFSTAPGMGYEYSNTGFAILGQIIARVSGMRARDFIDREIIRPLGMTRTKWDTSAVPGDLIAHGYAKLDNAWVAEKPLADGSFGVMGGLYSTVPDLAKLVATYLQAYPARSGEETGPIKRASLREMQMPQAPYRVAALRATTSSPLTIGGGGYAFGLSTTQNCRFGTIVSHSGGLPGYGSQMRWLPEYGVGVVALANGTYAGPGRAVNEALEALARTGGLERRAAQPSASLLESKAAVDALFSEWSDDGLKKIAAMNLLLDRSLDRRRKDLEEIKERVGACRSGSDIEAENALRGRWTLSCERGSARVAITLAPTKPPTVQSLQVRHILPGSERFTTAVSAVVNAIRTGDRVPESRVSLSAPADLGDQISAARAYGTCAASDMLEGGPQEGVVRLTCAKGKLDLRLSVDDAGLITFLRLSPAAGEACVP